MSDSLSAVLAQLDALAAYKGTWRPLRDELPLLQTRVAELRERETRLDDLLVVALVGGSGVGKSTLLNALAGDQLAATSEYRPCTSVPTVYQPPGANFGLDGWQRVYGSALEHLILIDTPDSDTVVRQHRESVVTALSSADLILVCGSPEKYLDEATWSLLRPLQGERTLICVETKADLSNESVKTHWTTRLREQGFNPQEYFQVSARRSLDRKLSPQTKGNEYDFERLETYLRTQLTREQAQRIKRSNAAGLLVKTVNRLDQKLGAQRDALIAVQQRLSEADKTTAREVCDLIVHRLFAEPHLWNFALGREISMRAKGIVGTLYRVLEALRSLPARLASRFTWGLRDGAGKRAAALLTDPSIDTENIGVVSEAVHECYARRHAEIGVELARAAFDTENNDGGYVSFSDGLQQRISSVLRGPARDRLVSRARWLTSWPATMLADAPPIAFMVYAGYRIVSDYFQGIILTGDYFLHAGAVLVILLALELLVISTTSRVLAWTARKRSARDLRTAVLSGGFVFARERAEVDKAVQITGDIHSLTKTLGT